MLCPTWGNEPICQSQPCRFLPRSPEGHTITLIDESVEPIDYDRVAMADIVGLTGMDVQGHRMLEILAAN